MHTKVQEQIRHLESPAAMKKNVATILNTAKDDSSVLIRIADTWGRIIPWWAKALGLLIVSIPTVVVAVLLQAWVVFAVTAIIALFYIGISLLLDNHCAHDEEKKDNLSTQIFSLIDLYGTIIHNLYSLLQDLGFEMDKLQENNQELCINNEKLTEAVEQYSEHLVNSKQKIDDLNTVIENSNRQLQSTIESYEGLLTEKQGELEQNKLRYNEQNTQLTHCIDETKLANGQLHLQLAKMNRVVGAIQESHKAFIALDKSNNQSLMNFDAKLQQLLDKETTLMQEMTEKIVRLERVIDNNQQETAMLNKEYKEIIQQERERADFLKRLIQEAEVQLPQSQSCASEFRMFRGGNSLSTIQEDKLSETAICTS